MTPAQLNQIAKMKRELTPEQIAKRDARRERFRAIASQISKMTDEQRAQLAMQCHPTTIEGHAVSLKNACLIALQKPDATIVGGFRQWLASGRSVRKGESGLMIWAPGGSRKPVEGEATPDSEEVFFLPVTVFDVSQTEIKSD